MAAKKYIELDGLKAFWAKALNALNSTFAKKTDISSLHTNLGLPQGYVSYSTAAADAFLTKFQMGLISMQNATNVRVQIYEYEQGDEGNATLVWDSATISGEVRDKFNRCEYIGGLYTSPAGKYVKVVCTTAVGAYFRALGTYMTPKVDDASHTCDCYLKIGTQEYAHYPIATYGSWVTAHAMASGSHTSATVYFVPKSAVTRMRFSGFRCLNTRSEGDGELIGIASRARRDGNGNNIVNTYAPKSSLNDRPKYTDVGEGEGVPTPPFGDGGGSGPSVTVIDSLTSESTTSALSARQGKALKALIDAIKVFSGSYNDLTDKPTIPSAITEATVSGWGFTKNTGNYNKPTNGIPLQDLATEIQNALSKANTALQSYAESDPTVPSFVKSITQADIDAWNGKQDAIANLAAIIANAANGATAYGYFTNGKLPYASLSGTPTIPAAQVQSDWNATSGMGVILNKPTIPAAQVNSDWNATSGKAQILNKPTIPSVVTSMSSSSTDAQVPSAKAVYAAIGSIETSLANINTSLASLL